jgi:hypothetical protein
MADLHFVQTLLRSVNQAQDWATNSAQSSHIAGLISAKNSSFPALVKLAV